jgi:hypothetical protein
MKLSRMSSSSFRESKNCRRNLLLLLIESSSFKEDLLLETEDLMGQARGVKDQEDLVLIKDQRGLKEEHLL